MDALDASEVHGIADGGGEAGGGDVAGGWLCAGAAGPVVDFHHAAGAVGGGADERGPAVIGGECSAGVHVDRDGSGDAVFVERHGIASHEHGGETGEACVLGAVGDAIGITGDGGDEGDGDEVGEVGDGGDHPLHLGDEFEALSCAEGGAEIGPIGDEAEGLAGGGTTAGAGGGVVRDEHITPGGCLEDDAGRGGRERGDDASRTKGADDGDGLALANDPGREGCLVVRVVAGAGAIEGDVEGEGHKKRLGDWETWRLVQLGELDAGTGFDGDGRARDFGGEAGFHDAIG